MKIFEIKEGFKNEIKEVKKQNIKLERRTDEYAVDIAGLVEMLDGETGNKGKMARDPFKMLNPKMRAKVLADK